MSKNEIIIKIQHGIKSNDWHRVAINRAKKAAAEKKIDWMDAEVFVHLPEAGRFFLKRSGYKGLNSYG